MVRPVANEAASVGKLAAVVNRGHLAACRQRDELGATGEEQRGGANHQWNTRLERTEGFLEFGLAVGLEYFDRNPEFSGGRLNACRHRLGARMAWLDEQRHAGRLRSQFTQQTESFFRRLGSQGYN